MLRFRKPGGEDVWLVASPSRGVWVSERVSERSETKPFTSELRSGLERAKFARASQVGLDRVFVLAFSEGESETRLVVELMPPGNIILVGGAGQIVSIAREVRTPKRRLVKGGSYTPPIQRRMSPDRLTEDDLRVAFAAEDSAGKALGKNVSLPRKYVIEALGRLSLAEGDPSSKLVGREGEAARVFSDMVEEARTSPSPCICETPEGDEIFAIAPVSFKARVNAPSLSAICDELFLDQELALEKEAPSPEDAKKKELDLTISRLRKEEEEATSEAARLRQRASSAAASATVGEAMGLLEGAGGRSRKRLDSTAAVASYLYDRAKEMDAKAGDLRGAAARLAGRSRKASSKKVAKTRQLVRRKSEWYEKFRWFYTSSGKLALGGRDASSNSILVRRHMEDNDVVYHADLFGSPFFLLKGGRDQTEEDTREVAQATVAFSSAWKTGLGSADAYWVRPDQVAPAAPSGEYLPRGSFAITGKKNFVNRNFVELAVRVDEQGRVVAAPESALSRTPGPYLVLKPHREKSSETAKKVYKEIQGHGEPGRASPSLDDVLRTLPTGGGRVVRRREGPHAKPAATGSA